MDSIYLDHNATTPVDPRVLERFCEVESRCGANPSSGHGPGRRARAVVEDACLQVAEALGCDADQVYFVSGGTEANNLAVLGLGTPDLPVLCAPTEHASVREPAHRRGMVSWSVDAGGAALVETPQVPVGLLCLVHGQSEVGTIQPVVEARALANNLSLPLHVDAAQTLGRIDLREAVGLADSLALSPHKAGGLRGQGVLIQRGVTIQPLMTGGGQEGGLRPGTLSPALCAASALAVELSQAEWHQRAQRMAAARSALLLQLQELEHVRVLTPMANSLPNTVMLAIDGIDGRTLMPALDLAGLAVSHGSACATGSPQPPDILMAMGLPEDAARACIRISTSHRTETSLAEHAGSTLAVVLQRLRKKN